MVALPIGRRHVRAQLEKELATLELKQKAGAAALALVVVFLTLPLPIPILWPMNFWLPLRRITCPALIEGRDGVHGRLTPREPARDRFR